MITNHKLVFEYLSNWIYEYIKDTEIQQLVIGFRGSRADAILLKVCADVRNYKNIKVHAIGNSNIIDNLIAGISEYKYSTLEDLYLQCHYLADDNNGLLIGPIDRTFGLYYRSYGKCAEGLCDIFPLLDLNYSEVIELSDYLYPKIRWNDYSIPMYNPDYENIEYCNDAEYKYKIITNEQTPNHSLVWPYYISSQKEMIAFMHQREKKTRHKILHKPYPILWNKPQLICKRVG